MTDQTKRTATSAPSLNKTGGGGGGVVTLWLFDLERLTSYTLPPAAAERQRNTSYSHIVDPTHSSQGKSNIDQCFPIGSVPYVRSDTVSQLVEMAQ